MKEAAFVFDKKGNPIYWHTPPGRDLYRIPDSRELWEVIWDARYSLHGIAHSHPWQGYATPSTEDLTTFAAIETGLDKRLVWAIVTLDHIGYFTWKGPAKLDYDQPTSRRFRFRWQVIERLRQISINPRNNHGTTNYIQ